MEQNQGRCKHIPCDGPWAGTSCEPGEEVELSWAKARINLSRGEQRKERSEEEQSQGS